jgi:hypothetical protein
MRLLLLLTLIWGLSAHSNERIQNHQKAVDAFLDLNFFYKGRGMVVTPDLIKLYEALKKTGRGTGDNGILNKRWGLNLIDGDVVGLFNIPYKKMSMGVLGCVACHSGKAAGRFIVGLGNKNIDVGQVGDDAYVAQFLWNKLPRAKKPEFKAIHKRAMNFVSILKNDKINNLTQGLVPTAQIKSWFYEINDLPFGDDFGRGQVKVPHLWGYGLKRKTGSFWDGFANGVLPGWAVAVELRGGQSVENIREYEKKVHVAEDVLGDLLPPRYPFKIDHELAKSGSKLFAKNCQGCHGNYQRDVNGQPLFKSPKLIPKEVVKTDTERLDFVTDEFLVLVDNNPLNDMMQYLPENKGVGYVAPRLWGIWSRFPYLHNASVPTLMDLLKPATERPVVFDLYRAGEEDRFDQEKLGLKINRNQKSSKYKKMLKSARKGARNFYYAKRVGHKNSGHEFKFYKNLTDAQRLAIIEYLKTL